MAVNTDGRRDTIKLPIPTSTTIYRDGKTVSPYNNVFVGTTTTLGTQGWLVHPDYSNFIQAGYGYFLGHNFSPQVPPMTYQVQNIRVYMKATDICNKYGVDPNLSDYTTDSDGLPYENDQQRSSARLAALNNVAHTQWKSMPSLYLGAKWTEVIPTCLGGPLFDEETEKYNWYYTDSNEPHSYGTKHGLVNIDTGVIRDMVRPSKITVNGTTRLTLRRPYTSYNQVKSLVSGKTTPTTPIPLAALQSIAPLPVDDPLEHLKVNEDFTTVEQMTIMGHRGVASDSKVHSYVSILDNNASGVYVNHSRRTGRPDNGSWWNYSSSPVENYAARRHINRMNPGAFSSYDFNQSGETKGTGSYRQKDFTGWSTKLRSGTGTTQHLNKRRYLDDRYYAKATSPGKFDPNWNYDNLPVNTVIFWQYGDITSPSFSEVKINNQAVSSSHIQTYTSDNGLSVCLAKTNLKLSQINSTHVRMHGTEGAGPIFSHCMLVAGNYDISGEVFSHGASTTFANRRGSDSDITNFTLNDMYIIGGTQDGSTGFGQLAQAQYLMGTQMLGGDESKIVNGSLGYQSHSSAFGNNKFTQNPFRRTSIHSHSEAPYARTYRLSVNDETYTTTSTHVTTNMVRSGIVSHKKFAYYAYNTQAEGYKWAWTEIHTNNETDTAGTSFNENSAFIFGETKLNNEAVSSTVDIKDLYTVTSAGDKDNPATISRVACNDFKRFSWDYSENTLNTGDATTSNRRTACVKIRPNTDQYSSL